MYREACCSFREYTRGHRGSRGAIRRVACRSLPRFVYRYYACARGSFVGEKCVTRVCAYERAFTSGLSRRFVIPFPFDARLDSILSYDLTPSLSVLSATICEIYFSERRKWERMFHFYVQSIFGLFY